MTIKEILQKSIKILAAKKIESASLDAELLLLYALNRSRNKPKSFRNDRSWIYTHDNYRLLKPEESIFLKLIKRREKLEPLAYIIGKREFFGLEFHVDKSVLIPRPETEIMVEECMKDIIAEIFKNKKITIADIGTGSGAIAISIAHSLKEKNISGSYKIFATDISSAALNTAEKNAEKNNCGEDIIFKKGNLLKALPKNTKIDFFVANLPYVRKDYCGRLKNKCRLPEFYGIKYEPRNALLAGTDGMKYFREFFRQLPGYLAKNTEIFLESDPEQIPGIKKLAKKYLPEHAIEIFKDLRGLDRMAKIELR